MGASTGRAAQAAADPVARRPNGPSRGVRERRPATLTPGPCPVPSSSPNVAPWMTHACTALAPAGAAPRRGFVPAEENTCFVSAVCHAGYKTSQFVLLMRLPPEPRPTGVCSCRGEYLLCICGVPCRIQNKSVCFASAAPAGTTPPDRRPTRRLFRKREFPICICNVQNQIQNKSGCLRKQPPQRRPARAAPGGVHPRLQPPRADGRRRRRTRSRGRGPCAG